ncbi:hypothetical protein ACH5RR_024963 [Cinchona calisaya]|uniref:Cleavage stimulating factor 64 n=1 Tax=Cinchona calisaya TaxID=153742 RepID=A0ABD2Z0A2_9GENT
MAEKQVAGDGLSASLAGMSKNQLYDIMSQMKQLIEQNQQQARQILIQNPVLTRALFQAQIMLGMVQPPQAIPNVQPAASQNPQPSKLPIQQSNIRTASPLPGKIGLQEQTIKQEQIIKQEQNLPATTVSSASVQPSNLHPPSFPSHSLQSSQQPKGYIASQPKQMPVPQAFQLPNMLPLPHHAASPQPPSLLQPPMPSASSQLQQPMQSTSIPHLPPLQPPLTQQPRPQMSTFPHQGHPQIGLNVGFQHSAAPQPHYSQPVYHSGTRPPAGAGPSFHQGQPSYPIQAPLQPPYQVGGSHLGPDFNQIGSSNQADRGSPWAPGLQESTSGAQLPGPLQFPGQMVPGNQPTRPPSLTPEMEKALLQQVMSLTPEQINQLPPEQRNQVLQLQQMIRP